MKSFILLTAMTGSLWVAPVLLAADAPVTNSPVPASSGVNNTNAATNAVPATNDASATAPDQAPPPSDDTPQPAAATSDQVQPTTTTVVVTNQTPATPEATPASDQPATPVIPPVPRFNVVNQFTAPGTPQTITGTNGDKGLRLNFRGVPLEAVLNYMSDAAGFIIHPKVDVRGKVDVWSNQPLTPAESVKLLKQILNENGYTVLQEGRTLTIIRSEDAKNNDIPVNSGNIPSEIPKNADIVTQIIPVHSLNVVELVKTLQPLLPTSATLASDESANSLVMTDTQSNVRHIVEIIHALDTVTSSSASIKVFKLNYADSKSLASLIKDLFSPSDSSNNSGGRSGGFGGFGRFRGGFGGFPGAGAGGENNSENGHTPTAKVTAVSDDHSNSLIVSAPDALINDIEGLVKAVDMQVEDTTEVHVFHLINADPTEMADLLTSLFPDDSNSADATRSPFRFGFGFPGAQPVANNNNQSARLTKMSHVIAVADRRTASLIVTAGKDLMPEIAKMVLELDARKDRKQTPHVIPLANADPIDVQQILQDIFPSSSSNGRSTSSSGGLNSSTSNPLLNRQTTILQQQNNSTTGSFGNSAGSSGSGRNF